MAWAHARYTAVLAADGATLDALLRQVGLLRDRADTPLAGRMTALLDLGSRLPPEYAVAYAVALYGQRWRIEDGDNAVKRLLGLAYFWVGSANGVQLQLWATWLLYAVLIDLTDAVAEELQQPFAALSLEMVYRSLYSFTAAYQRGAASDVVLFLAAEAANLGIVKRKRKRDPTPSRFDQLRLTFAATA